MKDQISLRLPTPLAHALDTACREGQVSRSDVIRMALQQYLAWTSPHGAATPYEKARHLLGTIQSGDPDRGSRHREYLKHLVRRGR